MVAICFNILHFKSIWLQLFTCEYKLAFWTLSISFVSIPVGFYLWMKISACTSDATTVCIYYCLYLHKSKRFNSFDTSNLTCHLTFHLQWADVSAFKVFCWQRPALRHSVLAPFTCSHVHKWTILAIKNRMSKQCCESKHWAAHPQTRINDHTWPWPQWANLHIQTESLLNRSNQLDFTRQWLLSSSSC